MPSIPDKRSLFHDELFRQVVAIGVDEVDDSLSSMERERCISEVLERMQGEIREHLAMGDLRPELISIRVRQEAVRAVEGGTTSAA